MSTTATTEVKSDFTTFFTDQLKDIYWAEKHIVPGLKKMCKATTDSKLRAAFEEHLAQSEEQLRNVERLFEILGRRPAAKTCAAMEGLLKEAGEVIESTEKGSFVRDAALIMAAQKIEHYEIATYGTLCVLAGYLEESEELQPLLREILDQEKKADIMLSKLAEEQINRHAARE